jgi:hypothetical protein
MRRGSKRLRIHRYCAADIVASYTLFPERDNSHLDMPVDEPGESNFGTFALYCTQGTLFDLSVTDCDNWHAGTSASTNLMYNNDCAPGVKIVEE